MKAMSDTGGKSPNDSDSPTERGKGERLSSAMWDYAEGKCIPLDVSDLVSSNEWQSARRILDLLAVARERLSGDTRPGLSDTQADELRQIGQGTPIFPRQLGRFRLLREIGAGGFGIVYAAHDDLLRRHVAVKIPRLPHLFREDSKRRFLREAHAAARLSHPHLVTLHEVGEVEDVTYLVSSYCDGPNLATWMAARRSDVTAVEAARLVMRLASGVFHAHARSILHCDIKPANILLVKAILIPDTLEDDDAGPGGDGDHDGAEPTGISLDGLIPMLTDFGLARLIDFDATTNFSGMMAGTPAYMAPELASHGNKALSPQADIYSLGAVLFELITGEPPYRGDNVVEVLSRLATQDPCPCRRLRPECPRDLEAVVAKCLNRTPSKRYATAHELEEDLGRFLAGETTRARPVGRWGALVKWAMRQPILAASLATMIVGSTIFTSVSAWYVHRVRSLNDDLQIVVGKEQAAARGFLAQKQLADERAAINDQFAYAAGVREAFRLYSSGEFSKLSDVMNSHSSLRNASSEAFEIRVLRSLCDGPWSTIGSPGPEATALVFSRDRRHLIFGDAQGMVRMISVPDGTLIRAFRGAQGPVNQLFLWTDEILCVAEAGPVPNLRAWHLSSDREPTVQPGGGFLCLAPDGQEAAAIRSENWRACVRIIKPVPGGGLNVDRNLRIADEPMENTEAAAYSPNGRFFGLVGGASQREMGGGWENRLIVWDRDTWKVDRDLILGVFPRVPYIVSGMKDSEFIIADGSGDVMCFDAELGTMTRGSATASETETLCLTSPRDSLLRCGFERRVGMLSVAIDVLDPNTLAHRKRLWEPHVTSKWQWCAEDGSLVARGEAEGRIRLRDMTSPKGIWEWKPHKTEVWSVTWSPKGDSIVTTSDDHSVCLTDSRTLEVVRRFQGHTSLVTCATFSPHGTDVYSASYDGSIIRWNIATGEPTVLARDRGKLTAIAVDSTDRWCVFGDRDHGVTVMDLDDANKIVRQHRCDDTVRATAVLPDRIAIVIDESGTLTAWDWTTGRTSLHHRGSQQLSSMHLQPSGQFVVTGDVRGLIRRWPILDGVPGEPELIGQHLAEVLAVAASPDGRLVASGGMDSTVRVWDLSTSTEMYCFQSTTGRVNAVAWSPNGHNLAAARHDGSVLLWATDDGPAGRSKD